MRSRATREGEPLDGSTDDTGVGAETATAPTSFFRRPAWSSALGHQEFDSGERKHSVLRSALGLTVLAIPIAAYFWFIDHFSVNVVYLDQWSNIQMIQNWHTNGLNFGDLWALHYDHRMLFPNLIVVALTQFTHFNVIIEEYISALMLVASTALVIATHRRRSRSTPLIWYLPVVVLLFSFVQYQNTLWGFQVAWYLVTLGLATALYFLDRPNLTQAAFLAALAATVIASYSSLQGLIVWPVGLVLLYLRRRSREHLAIWCTLAVMTTVLYFYHWTPGAFSKPSYAISHPIAALKFFLFLMGSVLGVQTTNHTGVEIALGTVVVAVSIGLIVRYWRRDEQTSRPFGVVLLLYGLLFGATITQARTWLGLSAPSRYSTCALLALAGCYLVLIDRSEVEHRHGDPTMPVSIGVVADNGRRRSGWSGAMAAAWVVVIASIALEVTYGNGHGFVSAKAWSQNQMQVADITVNYQEASTFLLGNNLIKLGNPDESRTLSEFMAVDALSVFGTRDKSYYASIGLFPALTAVQTAIVRPNNGAAVGGDSLLDAVARDTNGVVSVQFQITGSRGFRSLVGIGRHTAAGWLARWNTRIVPNGRYSLVSVATGYGGARVAHSAPVSVTVHN